MSRNFAEFVNELPGASGGSGGSGGTSLTKITMADDGTYALPAHTNNAQGLLVVGNDEERAFFTVATDGTVNIIIGSANAVANANTDSKFCIGTSVANPVVLKNRLGASKEVSISYMAN